MKHRIVAGAIAGLLAFGITVPAAAAARTVPVQVDGKRLIAESYLEDGVTHVPLQALMDAFGGWKVSWDGEKQEAVAVSDDHFMTANPTQDIITVDKHTYSGNVYIKNGRTYVPLRLTVLACGGGVMWDKAMGGAAVTSTNAAYDAEELYWLSRIISAESRGETLEGQIAVGNVVLNRVASDKFPDSVREVVFDRKDGVQFEPVSNGTIHHEPTEQSVTAAKRALDGEKPVGDCLYFYASALSEGKWINANRTYVKTIGCHRFFR